MFLSLFHRKGPIERFVQGEHRGQGSLLPESLDDYVRDTDPVRVVDVFVDELDLATLGFEGIIQPKPAGRNTTLRSS